MPLVPPNAPGAVTHVEVVPLQFGVVREVVIVELSTWELLLFPTPKNNISEVPL